MRTLQIYGTGSTTANNVANVTIPKQAKLKAIQASLIITSITAGALIRLELLKVPVTQVGQNGAIDPFFQIGLGGNFVTSGLAQYGVNQRFDVDVPCRQGEVIYLHATASGTVTYYFNGILWLSA